MTGSVAGAAGPAYMMRMATLAPDIALTPAAAARVSSIAAKQGRPAILPQVHMIITTRVYDSTHVDAGRVRQTWVRMDKARKSLIGKWWAQVGM